MDSVILYAYRFKYRQCISTLDSHFPGSKTLEPVPTSDSSENVNTWKHKTNSLQHKRRNKVFLTSALASGFETSEAELEQRERTHRHKARVKNIRPPFWDAGILGDTGTISRVGRKSATKVMQFSSTGWIISSRRFSRSPGLTDCPWVSEDGCRMLKCNYIGSLRKRRSWAKHVCLDTTKFVLLSFSTLIETICPGHGAKTLPKSAKVLFWSTVVV